MPRRVYKRRKTSRSIKRRVGSSYRGYGRYTRTSRARGRNYRGVLEQEEDLIKKLNSTPIVRRVMGGSKPVLSSTKKVLNEALLIPEQSSVQMAKLIPNINPPSIPRMTNVAYGINDPGHGWMQDPIRYTSEDATRIGIGVGSILAIPNLGALAGTLPILRKGIASISTPVIKKGVQLIKPFIPESVRNVLGTPLLTKIVKKGRDLLRSPKVTSESPLQKIINSKRLGRTRRQIPESPYKRNLKITDKFKKQF